MRMRVLSVMRDEDWNLDRCSSEIAAHCAHLPREEVQRVSRRCILRDETHFITERTHNKKLELLRRVQRLEYCSPFTAGSPPC